MHSTHHAIFCFSGSAFLHTVLYKQFSFLSNSIFSLLQCCVSSLSHFSLSNLHLMATPLSRYFHVIACLFPCRLQFDVRNWRDQTISDIKFLTSSSNPSGKGLFTQLGQCSGGRTKSLSPLIKSQTGVWELYSLQGFPYSAQGPLDSWTASPQLESISADSQDYVNSFSQNSFRGVEGQVGDELIRTKRLMRLLQNLYFFVCSLLLEVCTISLFPFPYRVSLGKMFCCVDLLIDPSLFYLFSLIAVFFILIYICFKFNIK